MARGSLRRRAGFGESGVAWRRKYPHWLTDNETEHQNHAIGLTLPVHPRHN
jgi:hypothetical protein